MTRSALDEIMASANKDLAQTRLEYQESTLSLVNDVYSAVTNFLNSTKVNELEENTSRLISNFVDEAVKVLNNTEHIQSQLEAMVIDFLESGFEKDVAADGRKVFRWHGDLTKLVSAFLEELKAVGKDPERNTMSVYELSQKLVQNATELADKTMKDMPEGNYSVATIEDVLRDALLGASDDRDFSRRVILREISTLVDKVAFRYGLYDVNSSSAIQETVDWVDSRLKDYSDGEIRKIPEKAFVAPLILVDYVLGQVSMLLSFQQGQELQCPG
jgi:hypothetical protein